MNRLLSSNDWDSLQNALRRKEELRLVHVDQDGYKVTASVERVSERTAAVIGHDMVLTVVRSLRNVTETQNFGSIEEAKETLYG